MKNINQDFTGLATQERQKNSPLKQSIVQLVAKLKVSEDYLCSLKLATQALDSVRKDYGELDGKEERGTQKKDRGARGNECRSDQILNMTEENCVSVPFFFFFFFFILTSIQTRHSERYLG